MVIQHNNSELTRVRPSSGVKQHSIHFDYSAEDQQLVAAISQSEHCEQELSYHCRKSRLLNTPGSGRFSKIFFESWIFCFSMKSAAAFFLMCTDLKQRIAVLLSF